jgi:tRNA(Ile)-lysidine synthase TilS/MesJ
VLCFEYAISLTIRKFTQICCADVGGLEYECHRTTKGNARVAVLFSGGIDSAVIAYLAHKYTIFDKVLELC